jgi:hypothetical protein
MTLNETVQQKLAEWQPPGDGRQVLALTHEGWSVAISADRKDDLGCLLWEVSVRAPGQRGSMTLHKWANQTAERIRGLLEPVRVVEIDMERNEAMLRSDGPSQKGDQVAYYEIMLQGTTAATLRRYQGYQNSSQRREQTAFTLTHEMLAKVIGDIAF